MGDWTSVIKGNPLEWLLEEDNPSVRYFTLTGLLDRPEGDPDVSAAKRGIMERGLVPRILEKQSEGGCWGKPEDFYIRSKYKGTVWTLILLAELGADGDDARIKRACEFILDTSQDRESGGFAYANLKTGGLHGAVLPCLTGNMVWSLIKFGYLDDPRVRQGIEFITKYRRFDDGDKGPPHGWPYDKFEKCWGRHTCHMGVVKALKALAEIPEGQRSKAVNDTICGGAEYLLKHHVFKRSHDLSRVSIPGWLQFSFPTMWRADILEILGILTMLGYRDERMQEAVDVVLSKQDGQGRWVQEDTYGGRYLVSIEKKGRPGKWITLRALKAIRSYYG
jgi:hypothetical protein